ncbi:unnamed protein product [marine sediment metagenome]|uniref:Radical SAM core domain-containing protein n=1 Tax=marine sediment metagenome TaxID=412755 RepID=X0WI97_9ZZZZ
MKIATMHRCRGDSVQYVKGRKKNVGFTPDIIYITTLFTFHYKIVIKTILFYKKYFSNSDLKVGGIFASLMPEFIKKHTGVECHFGLLPETEDCIPDYETIPSDCSIVFTSRGCTNKCRFCVVPKIEGTLTDIENWNEDINASKRLITFWDNNWFAKGYDLIKRDVTRIKSFLDIGVETFDFNQGLDARLFTEAIAKLLHGMPLHPIRFAFDNMSEDGYVQKALTLARKYNFYEQNY